MSVIILLRPIYVCMACTSKILPYIAPLLKHVVHATNNIRTLSRQIALLCSQCCLYRLLPHTFPNITPHVPPLSQLQADCSKSSHLLPLHFPRVQVCGHKCESRTVGTDLEGNNCDLFWRMAYCSTYRSFATTVSELKMCDFSGETFKAFEVL